MVLLISIFICFGFFILPTKVLLYLWCRYK
jgi:hypothetical protein